MREPHGQKLPFAFIPLLLFSLPCAADELESRVQSLKTKMAAIKTETARKTSGVQFAPGGPQYDGYGLYATADLLLWHLSEGGSDYALSHHGTLGSVATPFKGKSSTAHFNWDFGFRTGAGYTFEHDAWDVWINFTWFQTKASNTAHKPNHGGLFPQKGFPLPIDASSIHCDWNVHYYTLDLELGRRFFLSRFFSVRPQMGIESAWISQRRGFAVTGEIAPAISGENIKDKNSFAGVGPRIGVDSTWYLGRHFSLLGSLSGALLWGRFEAHTKESLLTPAGKEPFINVDGNLHTLVPNAQMKLGLGWDANIRSDNNHLGIALVYEFQYWWRQNQFINEPFATVSFQHESMDLSINGLTLEIRFDF